MSNYLSSSKPDFAPFTYDCGGIPAYQFSGDLKSEIGAGRLTAGHARDLLEDMLIVREVEEMIVRLRSGAYEPIPDFNYRGPTHVSVGQEASSVGASSALTALDYITSTHRGHGDSLARGCVALRQMTATELRTRLNSATQDRETLLGEALTNHVYRTIAELFGKEDGYCKGRGGSMHIADFSVGHLGANAIVGGNVPIATGAALVLRYLRTGGIVCCFAGDGAFSNGVVLEALNFAAQAQFVNEIADGLRFGMPIVFLVMNNHYGMTGRADNEVTGVAHLARRGAGFADNNMHAEIVNGMDVLAVRDAVLRAVEGCREGRGPYLLELNTYRYYGHSLSDPRNEYRTRDEEASWRKVDPV
jgi:2-oxoisovalerate dehydrogenase E1 component